MASAGAGGSLPPNFILTPQQQTLLFAALNSNRARGAGSSGSGGNGLSLSPTSFDASPMNGASRNFQESPYLDNYSYDDVGDSSFDFSFADDQPRMIGDLPESAKSESAEGDGNEKRSHPDDETERNDPKRRESTDKVPKKPGRKPLTSEPSSKRKAQNRAAQRAFRERKEQHLKNLETKVEELTKASEAANHENSKLRAQVSQMTTELNQYKQRLSLLPDQKPAVHTKQPFGNSAVSNLNDISFQFNFPKFGSLPGSQPNKPQRSVSQPMSPHQQQQQATSPTKSQTNDNKSPPSVQQTSQDAFKDDYSKFSGIFTPSMTSSTANDSRASVDSANYSSPSASSNSNAGPSSSCGTSPEPFTQQSPIGSKPVETMTTIGEEQMSLPSEPFTQFANIDFGSNTNFDWLAQQNGGFEPDIFNDYRDPQETVPSNITFDDYFNDAIDVDFFTPYNVAPSPNFTKAAAAQPKKNLIDEIDAQKNDFDDVLKPQKENMSCDQIWEKLQAYPNAQPGDFDLDGLCSELTKKAKCSGTGPVVGEQDFDTILRKYMGKDVSSDCVASSLGIEVNRDGKRNGVGMP